MRKLTVALVVASALATLAAGQSEVANGPTYRGVEVAIDLPMSQRVRNKRGTDRAGLCVFATLNMIANYQNIKPLFRILEQMTAEPGGGEPDKVNRMIAKYAPGYDVEIVHYQGTDPAILDLAIKTGRPVAVTYGYGEFYKMQTIYHMVMLVHLDSSYAAIIDNNDESHVTWMTRAEFLKRWVHPDNRAWAFVILDPPPPPQPRNRQ